MDQTIPEAEKTSGDILIVDDNVANLLATETALGGLGGHVVRARSGEEALRILLERDFALILLDVKMPSLGGFETARLIRERRRSRHTPIIFITAYGRDEQDVLAAYNLGAVDFLFKPIVAEVLQSKASVFVELQRRNAEVAHQAAQLRDHERRAHEQTLADERRRWDDEALRRQMTAMAEADQRKDEFLAMLGHELRNPLSAIVIGCDLLLRKLKAAPGIDETVFRTRARIDRQAQHLKRLVDDLLDIARINSGKVELKKTATSIQDVIENAVTTSQPAMDERGHKLIVDVPPQPVMLFADADRLTQVVANLLNNAARYTDDGGSIRVECRGLGDTVEIRVIDSGRGIAPDLLPRIFDIFVQEQKDGSGRGLGLGLTIVKRLVTIHQGTVSASSDGPGEGSTFTITLPVGPVDPALREQETAPEQPAQPETITPLKIVLVEDNEDIRDSMRELLMSVGHVVDTAADGAAGAELILRAVPDVALVDLGLPMLDGYQVAQRVRAQLGPERVRLIAMTGYGQDADRRRTKEAGFDAHLVKPAEMDALMKLLSTQGA
jgi:signal transduction histidine kinase